MRELEVSLIEWAEGRAFGRPRLLESSTDPELVSIVRERLAAERRRELARLEAPVRLASEDQTSAKPEPGVC